MYLDVLDKCSTDIVLLFGPVPYVRPSVQRDGSHSCFCSLTCFACQTLVIAAVSDDQQQQYPW